MSTPWKGAARPMSSHVFTTAAQDIGCDEAVVRAVWQVEASGRGFLSDGSVIRRFEPHHMPGSGIGWRDSMAIGAARREAMFLEAYRSNAAAALRATSWGGPQIMGFNARDAGYSSARKMVEAMADSEDAHLSAFVTLIKSWGLDSALRACDWQTFATRYNGSGLATAYARKMEAALRGEGFDASEDGTGRGTPLVPIAFSVKDHGADAVEGVSPTLRAGGHTGSHANAGVMPAIAFDALAGGDTRFAVGDVAGALHGGGKHGGRAAVAFAENSRGELRLQGGDGQVSPQLTTGGGKPGQGHPAIATSWAVRRLTPLECERLQGFPDGYTNVPYGRRNWTPDGPRYKALGNSMAVNAMQWLGERIAYIELTLKADHGSDGVWSVE